MNEFGGIAVPGNTAADFRRHDTSLWVSCTCDAWCHF